MYFVYISLISSCLATIIIFNVSVAYDCPYNDDIQCNSNCYRAYELCYGGQRCSDINLNCSKLPNVLLYDIYSYMIVKYVFMRMLYCF